MSPINAGKARVIRCVIVSSMVVGFVIFGMANRVGATSIGPPALPSPPPVSAPVLDQAHILSVSTLRALDRRLGADNTSANGQIAITALPNTDGLPIAAYAEMLFNHWGIGHPGANDGVLILVDWADRLVRIQTGSGLVSRLDDAEAQSIIDTRMLPAFRAGKPDQAVTQGAVAVEAALHLSAPRSHKTSPWIYVTAWVLAGLIVLGLLLLLGKRFGPGSRYGPKGYWIGTGSTGGSSDGGGGFGGGSSGGGGATGGW